MASRTLYDPPPTALQWDVGPPQEKPCITVKLLTHDAEMHRLACEKEKEKAWAVAEQMLDALLVRVAAQSENVISSTPPFEHSTSLLSFLLSSSPSASSMSSICVRIPPVNVSNRGYAADAACRSVRTLVELDAASAVYEKLKQSLEAYVMHLLELLTTACESDGEGCLTFMRLVHVWGHYRLAVAELQEVWVYLDRWYISRMHAVRSIDGMAVAIMKEALLQHPWLLSRAQIGFLTFLRQDFKNESNVRWEILLFTNLCSSIEVYFLRVEPDVLAVAKEFYTEVADRMWHDGDSAEVFFQQVGCFLQEGRGRVQACLDANTMPKLEEIAQTSLLAVHGTDVLARDFELLVRDEKYDSIRLAWQFLALGKYVQLGKECGAVFREYILHEGVTIIRQLTSRPTDKEGFAAVKAMIALIRRGESVIEKCFAENSMVFTVQLNDALVEVLQENQTEFARQIARYIDFLMRDGESDTLVSAPTNTGGDDGGGDNSLHADATVTTNASGSDEVATATASATATAATVPPSGGLLNYIGRIYALLPSRGIFEAIYWHDLGRRLLQYQRPRRLDVERSFIQELKKACGVETSKFEGMFNDLKVSQELNERYQAWVMGKRDDASAQWPPVMQVDNKGEEEGEEKAEEEAMSLTAEVPWNTEVNLHILTSGFWPTQSTLAVRLPSPMHLLAKCVQDFYRHCFTDRQLVWQHQLSSAVVRCSMGTVRRNLTGTLLQAAILLTLQEMMDTTPSSSSSQRTEAVTVGALCDRLAVDISIPAVTGAIYGLCHPKFSLLLREPAMGGSSAAAFSMLDGTDRLRFNPHFAVSTMRCRIPFYNTPHSGEDVSTGRNDADGMLAVDDVLKEHKHVIEAAVVRFMKEKRCATHEDLVTAVTTLVQFPVTMATLKCVIERLIDRGFLERNGATAYTYTL
ncbi:hypothetical protein MOQ_005376 [Trypanosoma cruzi marinkellei]|uniref:Cullin family profile domain-containing protein n=1 Tax=Trypanosoma cruzi marinkellei TaxID=85056 RepID=K2N7T0_TRYCR|nr:hypothetical protein MOQ_005376 [Trypanosoma cruzi marinkellei]